ncbi:MAG: hypothetical protein Q8O67_32040 [Deltaproteobacteria bacterium]|nr:hypothetical protein [Deltaproteobacteria bacterium]
MTDALAKLAVDLGWSLWSEIGVPGVIRHHVHVAIDPEPLIVFSPWLFRDDARLQGEVVRWCVAHADRISASRLHGLLKTASPEVSSAFTTMATTLRAHGVLWTTDKTAAKKTTPTKPLALPTTRPALVRLRLRALAGVGARADVLAELLGREGRWLIASELQHLGYSKRNVARVLAELADADVVASRADRNAVAFKLQSPTLLAQLLEGQQLAWPSWAAVFALVDEVQQLRTQDGKSEVVRRVAAAKAAASFEVASTMLELERPMAPSWPAVVAWAEAQLAALADGTSPALVSRPK